MFCVRRKKKYNMETVWCTLKWCLCLCRCQQQQQHKAAAFLECCRLSRFHVINTIQIQISIIFGPNVFVKKKRKFHLSVPAISFYFAATWMLKTKNSGQHFQCTRHVSDQQQHDEDGKMIIRCSLATFFFLLLLLLAAHPHIHMSLDSLLLLLLPIPSPTPMPSPPSNYALHINGKFTQKRSKWNKWTRTLGWLQIHGDASKWNPS